MSNVFASRGPKHPDMTPSTGRRLLRVVGALGVAAAAPFFIWFALGFLDSVPSMLEVFGTVGLRIPASIVVGGLLLGAIGFYDL